MRRRSLIGTGGLLLAGRAAFAQPASRLVAATWQEHNDRPLLAQMHPVPKPVVDLQFLHAILRRFEVTEVAGLHPRQPCHDLGPGPHVAQCRKPFVNRRPFTGRPIGSQFDQNGIV